MADTAMELGINAKSVGEWVKRAEDSGEAIGEDERIELWRNHAGYLGHYSMTGSDI